MKRATFHLLFFLVPLAAFANDYKTKYDQYMVKSINDYIFVCDALTDTNIPGAERDLRITSCLSFVSGLLTGYRSTLSLKAEFEVAQANGVTREKIASQLDNNHELHEELTKMYFDSQFLCFGKNLGLFDIANSALKKLKSANIDKNYSADYFVLNEIEKQLACGK